MSDEPKNTTSSIIYGSEGRLQITNGLGETIDLTPIGNVEIDLAAEGEDKTVASFGRMEWGHIEVDFKLDLEKWNEYNNTFFGSRFGAVVLDAPISAVGLPVVGDGPLLPFVFAQVGMEQYQEAAKHLRLQFQKAGDAIVRGWNHGWNWELQGKLQWEFPRLKRTPVAMATRLRTQYPGLNKKKAERLAQSLRKRGIK